MSNGLKKMRKETGTPVSDLAKEYGLPEGSKWVGFVINREDTDEFLADINDRGYMVSWKWVKIPDLALTYQNQKQAEADVRTCRESNKPARLGLMWDIGDRYWCAFED